MWQRILEARFRTGSPYINFIDTANDALPNFQKELGLKIHGSNLCNEIHLATDEERTAVCCLSSVNLEKFDEWKDTTMVADLVTFLDNVLTEFIIHAPEELDKARFSAYRERSIGIGAMGFHGYLQSKGIAWESWEATSANYTMFKYIKSQAQAQTYKLAEERGECPDGDGFGVRNAHLLAIAPNANSSIICGCTASIEPLKSNMYVHRTRAGAHTIKNKYLEKVLYNLNKDYEETWEATSANYTMFKYIKKQAQAQTYTLAECSTTQAWSSSKAVLNTALSWSDKKSRCCTEPSLAKILSHVSS